MLFIHVNGSRDMDTKNLNLIAVSVLLSITVKVYMLVLLVVGWVNKTTKRNLCKYLFDHFDKAKKKINKGMPIRNMVQKRQKINRHMKKNIQKTHESNQQTIALFCKIRSKHRNIKTNRQTNSGTKLWVTS